MISWGRFDILKPLGTWLGIEDKIRLVISISERWKSLEQASAASLNSLGNHWLYRQLSELRIMVAT
jgi:hypothetical protein